MIVDKNLELSLAQLVTVTAASTDYLDQGALGDAYKALFFVVRVATTMTAGGSATLVVRLQTDSDPAFGTAEDLFVSPAIPVATLVAGYEVCKVRIPFGAKRYLRAHYTVATGPMTAGALDARLVMDVQTNKVPRV